MSRERTVSHRASGLPLGTLRVEVIKGPNQGETFTARTDTITVGSSEGNDLVLADETVSRYHLELSRKNDRIAVRDLGTTNGTALGSTFVERATVVPGAILTLGRTSLRVDQGETITVELHGEDRLGRLRGRSPDILRLMKRIEKGAESDASVLIVGETGTGKEVIAQSVHQASGRRGAAFETVDCGALLPTLIASELFGHEKGAFTGADRQHIGAFERADGGTIFLDEIGELPSALQPALLGALERRSFRRVGGTKQINVDVRVVSATNRDLRAEVNAGSFRQDLYYRLAVLTLNVPPLRDRPEDVPLLVEHFLREEGFEGDVEEVITDATMISLKQHHWPGNVRELRNFVEAALALGEAPMLGDRAERSGRIVSRGAVPEDSSGFVPPSGELLVNLPYGEARAELLQAFEGFYLKALLEKTRGNVSEASREAKMNRSHLIRMLKRHDIR